MSLHLNLNYQKSATQMPLDSHLTATGLPIDCQLTVTQLPLECHLTLTSTVIKAKNARLAQNLDHKGTPFEHFLRDLSTNEKSAFWALDQSEASISANFPASEKF